MGSQYAERLRGLALSLAMLAASLSGGAISAVSAEDAATPSPRALEALQLAASEDPYQRQTGFLRLEALREPATVALIRPYADDRDGRTRAYCLRALAAIQGAAAVPLLLERLRTEQDPLVRRAALLGLEPWQRANPEVLPAFIKALKDRNTAVRMTAVDLVSRVDDPRARAAILLRYKREHRRDVQRVLKAALRRLKG